MVREHDNTSNNLSNSTSYNNEDHLPSGEGTRAAWTWIPSLSFADGLPLVILMTVSLIFYKQMGLSNTAVTFYTSWMYLPWILKPIWSPFIDLVKTKRWWVLLTEILLGAAFGGVAFTIPTSFWFQGTLFFFWVAAFTGASHCVAADGFYLLALNERQQAWFMGIRQMADRLATIFGQGILVMVAGNLQVIFRGSISYSWSLTFYGLAGVFLALWLWHSRTLPHARDDRQHPLVSARAILSGFVLTFRTFLRKKGIIQALCFIMLFRFSEALLSKVSPLFLIDAPHNGGLGLAPQEYGLVQGTVGMIGVIIGSIIGGFAVSKGGLHKWLFPMVLAYSLPPVIYLALAYWLPDSLMLVSVSVFIEQCSTGFGLTAYMMFLIYYNRGEFRTSHYAIASALMTLSLMIPGLMAGSLEEALGYRRFFFLSLILIAVTWGVAAIVRTKEQEEI
jgi:PAT family beta-lactamase induction signal transducer AmpG